MNKKKAVIIVIFSMLFLWMMTRINIKKSLGLMPSISLPLFMVAFFIGLIVMLLWNLAWKFSLDNIKKTSYLKNLSILFSGAFGNIITPGIRLGGLPLRAYYLKKSYNGSVSRYLGSVLFDSTISFFSFLLFVIISSILLFFSYRESVYLRYISIILFLLISTIIYAIFNKKLFYGVFMRLTGFLADILYSFNKRGVKNKFLKKERLMGFVDKKLSKLFDSFKQNLNKKTLISSSLVHSIKWFFVVLKTYVIFLAFGYTMDFKVVFIIISLSNFIAYLSTVPGGIAITEISMIKLFSLVNVSPQIAAAVTIIDRGIFYFYNLVCGYAFSLLLHFKK